MPPSIDGMVGLKAASGETWRHRVTLVLLLSKKGVWLSQYSKGQRLLTDDMARRFLEVTKPVKLRFEGQARAALDTGWVYITQGDYVFLFVGILGDKLQTDEAGLMTEAVRELERKYQEGLMAADASEAIPNLGAELFRLLDLEPGGAGRWFPGKPPPNREKPSSSEATERLKLVTVGPAEVTGSA